jgi:hypothetical protein
MKDNKSSDSRRKLLKSIAAGSGAIVAGKSLPESWKRPVVDSVILPAHAQTSPAMRTYAGGTSVEVAAINDENMFASVSNMFISQAHAGNGGITTTNKGCATEADTSYDFMVEHNDDSIDCADKSILQISGTLPKSKVKVGAKVTYLSCNEPGKIIKTTVKAKIIEDTDTQIVIKTDAIPGVMDLGVQWTILIGGSCPVFETIGVGFCIGCEE